ncbi:DUF3176 multi-domain protein [Pyrenophora tritici-repentis]|nr:DUF3176 multi-domain protein [Pyrenophora tritici-repentis]
MEASQPPPSRPLLSQRNDRTNSRAKEPCVETKESPEQSKGCLPSFLGTMAAIPRGIGRGWTRFSNGSSRMWKKGWTAETFSCIFALLALLGLVATLLAHQDKPLPDWPQIVGINSIVSIFSMLIRAGVGMVLAEGISQSKWQWFRTARTLGDMEKFDSASRGAWGSVLLLFGFRIKKPYFIASMGAFITIMAAFTGFAAQQLIIFQDCQRPDNSAPVGIRRSNYFNAVGDRLGSQLYDEFLPMAVAMDIGMLQPVEDRTQALSYGCTTGNCTFPASDGPAYSTIAIGHTCDDVTSQVQEIPLTRNHDYAYAGTKIMSEPYENGTTSNPSNTTSMVEGYFNTTLPNGTYVWNIGLSLPLGDDQYSTDPLKFAMFGWPGALVTGVSMMGYNGTLGSVKMIYRPEFNNYTYYKAVSCDLYPTVNTYAVRYHNGVLQETLLSSDRMGQDIAFGKGTIFRLATKQTIRNGTLADCTPRSTPAPNYEGVARANVATAPINASFSALEGTPAMEVVFYPVDCVYAFSRASATGINRHLETAFQEQWLTKPAYSFNTSAALRRLYNDREMNLQSVDSFMQNLTTSMTTVLRVHGEKNFSQPALGTVWFSTTCIYVNWKWTAFPAVMIALSAVFLVLVAVESRGVESERLWKSSILAMLFCEMDEGVLREARDGGRRRVAEVAAKEKVKLGEGTEGLRLVGVDG